MADRIEKPENIIYGVDVGGTSIKLGAFSPDCRLLRKWSMKTGSSIGGRNIIPSIASEVLSEIAGRGANILGIGLGVPGIVTGENALLPCVNLDGWGGKVGEELSALCSAPVRMVNDANAAALGEYMFGSAGEADPMVFVTLGTGVGGGVIAGGKLIRGCHGAAGEFGHMKVYPEGEEICGCGKSGCFEKYASASSIVNLASKALARAETEGGAKSVLAGAEAPNTKDIFDAAISGDALAEEVCEAYADELGRGLASIATVIDPELFVLGGGVSEAGGYLLELVRNSYRRYAFSETVKTEIISSSLGNDAGIYGCAALIGKIPEAL